MNKQAFYEGTEVTIRGEKYIFPGLSLAQLEENIAEIEQITQMNEADGLKFIGKLAHFLYLAFSRNYPEISEAEFKSMIDIRRAPKLFQYVLGESGFEQGVSGSGEDLPTTGA